MEHINTHNSPPKHMHESSIPREPTLVSYQEHQAEGRATVVPSYMYMYIIHLQRSCNNY